MLDLWCRGWIPPLSFLHLPGVVPAAPFQECHEEMVRSQGRQCPCMVFCWCFHIWLSPQGFWGGWGRALHKNGIRPGEVVTCLNSVASCCFPWPALLDFFALLIQKGEAAREGSRKVSVGQTWAPWVLPHTISKPHLSWSPHDPCKEQEGH